MFRTKTPQYKDQAQRAPQRRAGFWDFLTGWFKTDTPTYRTPDVQDSEAGERPD